VRNERRALIGVAAAAAAIVTMASAPAHRDVTVHDLQRGSEQLSAIAVPRVPRQPAREPSAAAQVVVEAEPLSADPLAQILPVITGEQGIPATVRAAYGRAAEITAASDPRCGLTWEVLAGVGRVESGHASGGRVDDAGATRGRIVGIRLDGSVSGTATISDSDGGALDGDTEFDRAVGPMQFLPGTWAGYAADGNEDGVRDPHNVFDAALAAARLLCGGGGNLADPPGLLAALFRYNPSVAYGLTVQAWVQAYRTGGAPVIPAQDGAVPEPPPAPVEPPAAVLAAPLEAAPPEIAPTTTDEVPVPDDGTSREMSGASGTEGSAEQGTSEQPVPDASEQDGTTGDPGDDTAVESPDTTPGPVCDLLVLGASIAVVLPDTGGLLLRFPTDEIPDDCTITSATLRLDPGAAAADRIVQVQRVADEWSEQATQSPATAGNPVSADPGTGERAWSVDALVLALVEGPDRGLLLTTAGDGDPASLIEDGNARLEIVLGPAQSA
jgi:membrane-bound lytic murein transglycosylase B